MCLWLYIQLQKEREMPLSLPPPPPLAVFNSHSYMLSRIKHISRFCNIALLSILTAVHSFDLVLIPLGALHKIHRLKVSKRVTK